ncbi:MAG: GNAT family N-acetyltransferase [Cyanobacteria bacterium P01_A01_bin.84]
MKIHRFENPHPFYDTVSKYLLKDEGENILPIGICETLSNNPKYYDSQPYMVSVRVDDEIIAVAIRTPPHNLVLSKVKNLEAIELIAQDLYSQQIYSQQLYSQKQYSQKQNLPGVSGLITESFTFAKLWNYLTGSNYCTRIHLRIHRLQTVKEIKTTHGYIRPATEKDKSLLCQWYEEFSIEAMGAIKGNIETIVESQLKQNNIYLWQDEVPVTMVCCAGKTINSKRLGPVYTPPKYRRKGYATSCVAQVSQKFLNEGCQSCFLFTDIANPTSNNIYHKIGYQAVANWDEYEFKE